MLGILFLASFILVLRAAVVANLVILGISPWRMMKNDFISPLKLFSFSRYLSFVMTFWSCRKKIFITKIKLISKSMTSQPGQQTIAIHILLNISRSKSNQVMKFWQLLEYNMRDIFLQISFTKYDGETSPKPFSEKLKLSISLDQ